MRRLWLLLIITAVLATPHKVYSKYLKPISENVDLQQLQSLHFNIYFYSGQDSLANYTLQTALNSLTSIEEKIGYRLNGKLDIFLLRNPKIVNPIMDEHNTQNHKLTGGSTTIVNKGIYLPFDLSYKILDFEIRRGIAEKSRIL